MSRYLRRQYAGSRNYIFAERPWKMEFLGHRVVDSNVFADGDWFIGNEIVSRLSGYDERQRKEINLFFRKKLNS